MHWVYGVGIIIIFLGFLIGGGLVFLSDKLPQLNNRARWIVFSGGVICGAMMAVVGLAFCVFPLIYQVLKTFKLLPL